MLPITQVAKNIRARTPKGDVADDYDGNRLDHSWGSIDDNNFADANQKKRRSGGVASTTGLVLLALCIMVMPFVAFYYLHGGKFNWPQDGGNVIKILEKGGLGHEGSLDLIGSLEEEEDVGGAEGAVKRIFRLPKDFFVSETQKIRQNWMGLEKEADWNVLDRVPVSFEKARQEVGKEASHIPPKSAEVVKEEKKESTEAFIEEAEVLTESISPSPVYHDEEKYQEKVYEKEIQYEDRRYDDKNASNTGEKAVDTNRQYDNYGTVSDGKSASPSQEQYHEYDDHYSDYQDQLSENDYYSDKALDPHEEKIGERNAQKSEDDENYYDGYPQEVVKEYDDDKYYKYENKYTGTASEATIDQYEDYYDNRYDSSYTQKNYSGGDQDYYSNDRNTPSHDQYEQESYTINPAANQQKEASPSVKKAVTDDYYYDDEVPSYSHQSRSASVERKEDTYQKAVPVSLPNNKAPSNSASSTAQKSSSQNPSNGPKVTLNPPAAATTKPSTSNTQGSSSTGKSPQAQGASGGVKLSQTYEKNSSHKSHPKENSNYGKNSSSTTRRTDPQERSAPVKSTPPQASSSSQKAAATKTPPKPYKTTVTQTNSSGEYVNETNTGEKKVYTTTTHYSSTQSTTKETNDNMRKSPSAGNKNSGGNGQRPREPLAQKAASTTPTEKETGERKQSNTYRSASQSNSSSNQRTPAPSTSEKKSTQSNGAYRSTQNAPSKEGVHSTTGGAPMNATPKMGAAEYASRSSSNSNRGANREGGSGTRGVSNSNAPSKERGSPSGRNVSGERAQNNNSYGQGVEKKVESSPSNIEAKERVSGEVTSSNGRPGITTKKSSAHSTR